MSRYVVLEGPDGCGKSTQAERLAGWMRERGEDVLHLREPGSTTLGEGLRRVLLDPASGELLPLSEALLFTAARAELVRTVIAPALQRGTLVVAERCYLSTWVYQGLALGAGGVPLPLLRDLTARAHGETWPDRIIVLDLPLDTGDRRTAGQDKDRIEGRSRSYHEAVRAGYRQLVASESECESVDSTGDADAVHVAVRRALADLLEVPK